MNLKGRDFLKLLDYTTEEILGLIDLAADFKAKKRRAFLIAFARVRTSSSCLKRIPPVPAALLKWPVQIWAWL